jgi:hypothetical protein
MAVYTAVPTVTTGDLWTASNQNLYLRDNMAVGVPAIFSAKGDLAAATASQTAAVRTIGTDGQFLKADSGESTGMAWDGVTVGRHTVWLPAEAMFLPDTNPATIFAPDELSAGNPSGSGLEFLTGVLNVAEFKLPFPKRWNEGTVKFKAQWLTQGTDTGDVIWSLKGRSFADGDSLDQAFGTGQDVTDTASGTDNAVHLAAESSAITLAGTPGENEYSHFQLSRKGNDVGDDNTDSAVLLGIWVYWDTNAETDD